ncbi:MAG: ribonuclease III [Pirellulales bacterium]|nr:ribonuclease III [Pirellulales bacterium]
MEPFPDESPDADGDLPENQADGQGERGAEEKRAGVPGSDPELQRCEERIGHHFADRGLLVQALTHASGASHRLVSNERLEFLGDAILGSIVCEELYRRYDQLLEGDLTKIKSVVVSRATCARVSRNLSLDEFLILGKGMAGNAVLPRSLMAGVFESLVAAIYLDGGGPAAQKFIVEFLGSDIDRAIVGDHGGNFKSELQQIAQRDFDATPRYELLDEKGPDHDKCFKIAAAVGKKTFAPAWGRNKKDAEQRAAQNALAQLRGDNPPYDLD